ncbi:MAG TPA: hypothetical protein VGK19_07490 [Capsulimonadaceae bacterium]|jgi:homocitrate synthase NifV
MKPKLIDVTLREGSQAADVYFTSRQRRAILKGLAAVGIDEIEVGAVAKDADMVGMVAEARTLAPKARVAVWCRALCPDIELAMACEPDVISVSLPVSDLHLEKKMGRCRDWAIRQIDHVARLVRLSGDIYLSLGLEDATRADPQFLDELVCMAHAAGFDRIRIADTIGTATPATVFNTVRRVLDRFPVSLGAHMHNDFGMATANAITALNAGAEWADVSVGGVGERAGIARLEELAGYLVLQQASRTYDLSELASLAAIVAEASGDTVAKRQPIIGDAIFSCESGLHLDGLDKEKATYEPFPPEAIGTTWHKRLSMKAGANAVASVLKTNWANVGVEHVPAITARTRSVSRSFGRALTDTEFAAIVAEVANQADTKPKSSPA